MSTTRRSGPDLGFIRRVYRTSIFVYLVASLYVRTYVGEAGWWGLTAGTALSLLSLAAVERTVAIFLTRPGPPRRRLRWLWIAAFGKYLVYGVLVWGIARAAEAKALNLFAFLGGFVLVHLVILLKALEAGKPSLTIPVRESNR